MELTEFGQWRFDSPGRFVMVLPWVVWRVAIVATLPHKLLMPHGKDGYEFFNGEICRVYVADVVSVQCGGNLLYFS
ncbi:MAG: hypothetical protein LBB36_07185 [Fibromonadaceae bacterium]|jgi:hypothetical protein|nr:hypothetical protein [Fibromonadaceae bacterium]